jgi:hypothetical protein
MGLKAGISWIAHNDEPDTLDVEVIEGYISVHCLCAAFDKQPRPIAEKIMRERIKHGYGDRKGMAG